MPCHNNSYNLANVLAAYDRQDVSEPFELVAVDDASTDDTLTVLSGYRPKRFSLRILVQEKNTGPGGARNRAIPSVESPLILFVGDDILPERDLLRKHLQIHRIYSEPNYAVLGHVSWPEKMLVNTVMRHIDGIGAQQFSYNYFQDGTEYDFRHFYTANLSVKTEFLNVEELWFDPDFTYAAYEDIELAYRLQKKGLRILYSSAPIGWHYHYHTVWTFSNRQYRAGRMASVFESKHSGVIGRLPRLMKRYRNVLGMSGRMFSKLFPRSKGIASFLESATLRLGSFYEWTPNPLLDEFYLGLFSYYWTKGLIEGSFADSDRSAPLVDTLAFRRLIPLLIGFIHKARGRTISLPHGFDDSLLRHMMEIERPRLRFMKMASNLIGNGER